MLQSTAGLVIEPDMPQGRGLSETTNKREHRYKADNRAPSEQPDRHKRPERSTSVALEQFELSIPLHREFHRISLGTVVWEPIRGLKWITTGIAVWPEKADSHDQAAPKVQSP